MPSQPTVPVALDKAYTLAQWLIAKIAAMPRAHRFTLGDRLYSQSLDLVTALTQASFSRDKSRALETASDRVNSLRILLRLAKDTRLYRLSLHPAKCGVFWCRDGFPFLGFRLFPTHSRLVRSNVVQFRRRLRRLHADYQAGLIDWETVNQSVQAWIGHAMHGDTWRLREQVFEAFPFLGDYPAQ